MALVFDPHEKVNGNFFTDEAGVVFSGKNYRVLVPKNGPFFTNSLVVKCAGKVLRPGNDYVPTHLYRRSVLHTGRSTHGFIWLTNASIEAEDVTITYHAVGIGLATQAQINAERLLNEDVYPHLCSWDSVIGDVYFPPVDIQFDWENWKGEQALMNAIAEIAAKITEKPAPGEPEPIDKTMMMVEKYYQIVERLFRDAPAHAHILDKNNPHKDFSCARMGAVTLDGVVKDTNKAYGKTIGELTTHINNQAPTSASFADKMLRHTTNPRQITGTFKMFGGLSSVAGKKTATDGESDSAVMVNSKAVRFIGKDSTVIDAGNNPIRFKTKGGELVLWNDARGLQWNGQPLLDPISVLPHLPGTSGSNDGVFYGTNSPSVNVTGNGISTAPFTCTWVPPDSVNLSVPALRLLTDEFGSSETLVATPALIQKLDDAFKPTGGGEPVLPTYDPIGDNPYLDLYRRPSWISNVTNKIFLLEPGGRVVVTKPFIFYVVFLGMPSLDNELVMTADMSKATDGRINLQAEYHFFDPNDTSTYIIVALGVAGNTETGYKFTGYVRRSLSHDSTRFTFQETTLTLPDNIVSINFKNIWKDALFTISAELNGSTYSYSFGKNDLTGPIGQVLTANGMTHFLNYPPKVAYVNDNIGTVTVKKMTGTVVPQSFAIPATEIDLRDPISQMTNWDTNNNSQNFYNLLKLGSVAWSGGNMYRMLPTYPKMNLYLREVKLGVWDYSIIAREGPLSSGPFMSHSVSWLKTDAMWSDWFKIEFSWQYGTIAISVETVVNGQTRRRNVISLEKADSSLSSVNEIRLRVVPSGNIYKYTLYCDTNVVLDYTLDLDNLPEEIRNLPGFATAFAFIKKGTSERMCILNTPGNSRVATDFMIREWPGVSFENLPSVKEPISANPRLANKTEWAAQIVNSVKWKGIKYDALQNRTSPIEFFLNVNDKIKMIMRCSGYKYGGAPGRVYGFRWLFNPAVPAEGYLEIGIKITSKVMVVADVKKGSAAVVTHVIGQSQYDVSDMGQFAKIELAYENRNAKLFFERSSQLIEANSIINLASLPADLTAFLTTNGALALTSRNPDHLHVFINDPSATFGFDELTDSVVKPTPPTPGSVEYLPRLKSFVNGLSLANPVTLDKNTFGLGNVYDISDAELVVSTAQTEYIKDKALVGHNHTTEEFGIRESVDGNMGTVQFAGLVDDSTKALDSSLVPPQADTITELEKLGSTAATKPMLNIIRFGKTGDSVIVDGVTSSGWMVTVKANVYFVGKEYTVPLKTFNLAELFPTEHAENSFGIYVDLVGDKAEYKVLRNDSFPENSTLSHIGGLETSDVGVGSATIRNRTRLGAFEQLVNHVNDTNAHTKRDLTMAEYGYQHTAALPAWNAAALTVNRFDSEWRMFSNKGEVIMENLDNFSGGLRFSATGLTADNHRYILHNAAVTSYEGFALTPVPFGSSPNSVVELVLAGYLDSKGARHRISVIFNRGNAVTASDGRLCYAALAIDYGSQNQVLIGLSSTAFTTPDTWTVLKPKLTGSVRRLGSAGAGFITELEAVITYGTTTVTMKVEVRKGTVILKETRTDTGVNNTTDITSRLTQMGIGWDTLVYESDGSNVGFGAAIQFGMGGRFSIHCNMGFNTPAANFVRAQRYLTGLAFIEDISEMNRYRVVETGAHITPDTMRANAANADFAKRVDNPNGRPAYLNKQRLNLFVDKGVCKALVIRD